jgi:hypothetical protein
MGALLLHAALVYSLVTTNAQRRVLVPEVHGPGASTSPSSEEPEATLFLVQMPQVAEQSQAEDFGSLGAAPADSLVQILSPDPLPALDPGTVRFEDDPSAPVSEAENPAVRAVLFGRYSGQIDARIARAWRRPRSPVAVAETGGEVPFRCQVRIAQDNAGNVKEVQLVACNGSIAWQMSLVMAIQQASPLPAPPSPSVFTNILVLNFESGSYRPGGSEDGYEPPAAPRTVALPREIPLPLAESSQAQGGT